MTNQQTKGKLIVFEGIDGSGKSTQIQLLKFQLEFTHIARTFSSTVLGAEIEDILKGLKPKTEVEALLFAAARLQTHRQYTLPMLYSGCNVICDRYIMDAYAYSCNSRVGLNPDYIKSINIGLDPPDITFLLDIDPKVALDRLNRPKDHYEKEEFLEAVRQQYLDMTKYRIQYFKDQNWVVLDGSQSVEEVQSLVWAEVQKIL